MGSYAQIFVFKRGIKGNMRKEGWHGKRRHQ
uniref:Uncharacterized protein n=1 Tax=Siphoviridae sp. ctgmM3 TaxID=2827912 RepID=A0A8S5TJJ8_9CAUD|nr:MAG TPA: hypothetical protein [Siphoviridae sp. ctgmM3]